MASQHEPVHSPDLKSQSMAGLTLAAIGVVYGDIGTSPLYTFKEIFSPDGGLTPSPEHLIGTVSTILWALIVVVTLKYVILILRADNNGEGGALALTALATEAVKNQPRLYKALLLLGVFGATLFYGDSVITPAISVIGAMEGLEVLAPELHEYIIPVAVSVLIALFLVQRWGTAYVGRFFGPIIVLWFVVLGAVGLIHVIQQPLILAAFNPVYAISFLLERGPLVFVVVGAIVLAITGAEALYADMGHFGRKPIQIAWTVLVFPGLALNYLGQGALLMTDPTALENPFYRLFPEYLLIPALLLATMAAIIASQAVISGAYSVTKQAISMGFLPRMRIVYTSARESGQIYVPFVNWLLLAGVLLAVVGFETSSALAGAYGIAVTMTMIVTTVLTFFVVRSAWKLPLWVAALATLFFLAVDVFLFLGCIIKFFDGGWFPLVLGLTLFGVMTTWAKGRQLLMQSINQDGLALNDFLSMLNMSNTVRSSRTAIYPVANPDTVPQALLHNMKHNQIIHEKNVVLTVSFENIPFVASHKRVDVVDHGGGFWVVRLNFGFMESPDVPHALSQLKHDELKFDAAQVSYFLSRETVVPTPKKGMQIWREHLFAAMSRNSGGVVNFFKLPDNAVVELGTRVQI